MKEPLEPEEDLPISRERRDKNIKRRKEALKALQGNRLEIEKCQSIAPESNNYFES